MSPHKDNFAVVHHKEDGRDLVVSVGGADSSHLTEFVARVYLAAREAGNKIEVTTKTEIVYNNSQQPGKNKTLRFKANPAGVPGTTYKSGTVLYA